MGVDIKTKKINGITYSCTQLNAVDAHRLKFKIAKYIGEPLADLAKAYSNNSDDLSPITSLLSKLDDDDFFIGIYLKLINTCKIVDSKGNAEFIDFDRDFSGKLIDADKVFLFALMVNYEDFLNAIGSILGGDGKIAKKILEKI